MDFGGRRMAISNDGQTLIAGAYRFHGIAAYSGGTGAELWRRKDLKNVQRIHFNGDDSRVFCSFDSGPCESLNTQTGKSGKSLRGVRECVESPFAAVRFLERSRDRDYAIAGPEGPIATIPRCSFAVLSVAFSKSHVCVSEAGGPVRALDLSSGSELWKHRPVKGTHFLRVAFVERADTFVGVTWPFERGGTMCLQRFEPDGSATVLGEIETAPALAFASRGEALITAAGPVYDTVSGRQIGSMPFPTAPPRGVSP
jgi:hypothetical protein